MVRVGEKELQRRAQREAGAAPPKRMRLPGGAVVEVKAPVRGPGVEVVAGELCPTCGQEVARPAKTVAERVRAHRERLKKGPI